MRAVQRQILQPVAQKWPQVALSKKAVDAAADQPKVIYQRMIAAPGTLRALGGVEYVGVDEKALARIQGVALSPVRHVVFPAFHHHGLQLVVPMPGHAVMIQVVMEKAMGNRGVP